VHSVVTQMSDFNIFFSGMAMRCIHAVTTVQSYEYELTITTLTENHLISMRLLNLLEQILPGPVTYITRNRHYRWGCSMLAVPCLWLGSGLHIRYGTPLQ